jgi:hypothetical protein
MSARVASAILVGTVLLGAHVASAQPSASCDLIEISATTTKDPSIDADLKVLAKKLQKAPFSSWNHFAVLSRAQKTLAQNKPEAAKLSHSTATVLLSGISATTPPRVSLTVTIDDQDGKRVLDTKLNSDAGDWLVVGRSIPKTNDGELLALTCK